MNKLDIIKLATAFAVCLTLSMESSAQQPFDAAPDTTPIQENQDNGGLPTNPPVQIPDGTRFPSGPLGNPLGNSLDLDSEGPSQKLLVNTKFAGWEGPVSTPGDDERNIGDELRSNWIMVNPNGRFTGQVIAGANADVAEMTVSLLNNGRVVKQEVVNEQGQFAFTNIRQGAYAIVGWAPNGFFAFGVNILEHNPGSFTEELNHITPTAFQNETTINTDWIRYYANRVDFRVYGRYQTGEGPDDPSRLYGLVGLYNNLPQAKPATSISSHLVARTVDGRLVGRVHQMTSRSGRPVEIRSTRVILLENDSVVAASGTDSYGTFEFLGVPEGSYGLLAVGNDGVGLIGIEVSNVQPQMNADGEMQSVDASLIDFTLTPAETVGWLNDYANELAYKRNLLAPRPQSQQDMFANGCPTCGNQPGGCAQCQAEYLRSYCRSRGLTFEQWQMHCQGVKSGFGDGYFLREAGKDLRARKEKVDSFFEKTFYPNDDRFTNGYYNGGYNNGYNYNNGYYNNGYNYNNGAYAPTPAPAPIQQ